MSELILTPEARLSYPNLLVARAMKNADGTMGKAKFSTALLFMPGKPGKVLPDIVNLDALSKAAIACAIAKFGQAQFEALRKAEKFRSPFRKDGELKGYPAGTIYINVSSEIKPGVVAPFPGPDNKPRLLTDDEIREWCYAGARVRAQVKPYAYNNMGNAGVAFGLQNLQFLGHDDRLDGRTAAVDAFEAVASVDVADFAPAGPAAGPVVTPTVVPSKIEDLF